MVRSGLVRLQVKSNHLHASLWHSYEEAIRARERSIKEGRKKGNYPVLWTSVAYDMVPDAE